jgi:phospho-N-acetylmuramoyl-pentapeptide-transferase
MLYHLLYPLHPAVSFLNVFRYITFRTLIAALMALVVSLVLGPWLIRKLTDRQIGQTIRPDGPERHLTKAGTPTMGGALILFALLLPTLLLADLTNPFIWLAIWVTLGFAAIGFVDDRSKLRRGEARGLTAREKMAAQVGVALAAALVLYAMPHTSTELHLPFFKDVHPDLGWLYVPFAVLRPRRRVERGQPDRRARRSRDRAGDDDGVHLRHLRLRLRQLAPRHLPAAALRAGGG